MLFRQLFGIGFKLTLYVSCTLLSAGLAISMDAHADEDEDEYFSTWVFEHTEKYKMTWYYNTRKDFHANQPNRVLVGDKEFLMRPDVRPPTINGIYLLEYSKVYEGEDVLDMGTGSGLHAVFAAEKANRIVATDIYPPAVEIAKVNAELHGVEDKIDFRVGDLFAPIKEGEKFDVFFVNINFPFSVGDGKRNRLHERLFSEVRKYMKPNARIYYQTSFIKNFTYIYDMLSRNQFRIMEMHMEVLNDAKHESMFFMVQSLI